MPPVDDVVLRAWRPTDAAALSAAFAGSADLERQFGDLDLRTPAAAERFIVERLAVATAAARSFAVADRDRVVGHVGISQMEHRHGTGWVSYWLAAEHRGRGLATRALATVADWALHEQRLFRLELGHRVDNPTSCAVAVRAGFAAEGVERSKLAYGDLRFDVETHARLADDPPAGVLLLPRRD